MRVRYMAASVVVALALQGCAGTATVIDRAEQQSLQSLQLFNPDGGPRFTFNLSCTGEDASCVTVERAFSGWAQDRHISMQSVEPGDASLRPGHPSTSQVAGVPYRVAVHFAPLVIASYNKINVGADGSVGGDYKPPKVSYTATLYVFDAGTGKLLQQMPYHEQRTADFKADAGSYLRAEVKNFIASLDPAYQRN
jgi:hypothetical protein